MPRPKQAAPRLRRRIEVLYGPGRPESIGYSGNLSAAGIMLRTPRVFAPGTVLNLELKVFSQHFRLRGEVVWAREGPVQWLATGKVGMGIKFLDPPDAFLRALVEKTRRS